MSLAEDQRNEANAQYQEELKLAEKEHMAELARLMLKQCGQKSPELLKYIEKRKAIALQPRLPLVCSQVLPEHRQFKQ
jgi:hypothetical protein